MTKPVERLSSNGRWKHGASSRNLLHNALTRGFPYVLFDVPPGSDGDIKIRKVGAHAIGHARTARWSGQSDARHASDCGFGKTIKVVWQLNGAMRYEDRER